MNHDIFCGREFKSQLKHTHSFSKHLHHITCTLQVLTGDLLTQFRQFFVYVLHGKLFELLKSKHESTFIYFGGCNKVVQTFQFYKDVSVICIFIDVYIFILLFRDGAARLILADGRVRLSILRQKI